MYYVLIQNHFILAFLVSSLTGSRFGSLSNIVPGALVLPSLPGPHRSTWFCVGLSSYSQWFPFWKYFRISLLPHALAIRNVELCARLSRVCFTINILNIISDIDIARHAFFGMFHSIISYRIHCRTPVGLEEGRTNLTFLERSC